MKKIFLFSLFSATCLFGCGPQTLASWGPQGCGPVGLRVVPQPVAQYQWVRNPDYQDWSYLYQADRLLGGYCWTTGFYHPFHAGEWYGKAVAPVRPPFEDAAKHGQVTAFGVATEKRSESPRIWDANATYSAAEATQLLTAELPDDSRTGHLTVIARDPAVRKRVADDVARDGLLAAWRTKTRFQLYDPENAVSRTILAPFRLDADAEFAKSGVVVIAQAPTQDKDGRSKPFTVHRYDGPQTLIDALRRIDPTYDPVKPWLPSLPALPDLGEDEMILLILVCVILFFVIRASRPTT